jgi:hypothetical protein
MNKIIVAGLLSSAGVYCYFLFKNPILSKPVIKPIIKPVVISKQINVSPKKKVEIKPIPDPVIPLKPRKLTFSDEIIYKDIKDIQIKSPDKNDWEFIKENK